MHPKLRAVKVSGCHLDLAISATSTIWGAGRANHRNEVTPPNLPGGEPGSGALGGAAGLTPTEWRSSVSTEQQQTLDAILRQSAFPADVGIIEQRRLLRELISAQPLPVDVTVTSAALGGVPTADITIDGTS